jgi:hypothetical protein
VVEIKQKFGCLVVYLDMDETIIADHHRQAINALIEATVQALLIQYPPEIHNGFMSQQAKLRQELEESRQQGLSKSELLTYLQCPKKLWLQSRHPELVAKKKALKNATHSKLLQTVSACYQVDLDAPNRFCPILTSKALQNLFSSTRILIDSELSYQGTKVSIDLLIPEAQGWRLVYLVSKLSVDDNLLTELAIQSYVAQQLGFEITAIDIARVSRQKVVSPDTLFTSVDVSDQVFDLRQQIAGWIQGAKQLLQTDTAPTMAMGNHCLLPTECEFKERCGEER